MKLYLERTEFESGDWNEQDGNKMQQKLPALRMHTFGVNCTYSCMCYVILILVCKTCIADM
jgi:hypothetical protein